MTELRRADPDDVGLDPAGLRRVDGVIRSYIDRGLLAGAALLVMRDGAIAHLAAQGQADLVRGRAMGTDTLFRIFSMTKPITSVALMMLFEEGRVQLDDPVAKYIPAFADLRVFKGGTHEGFVTKPATRPMSVRDLLTHQSGLTYGFQSRSNVDAAYRAFKIDEFAGTLADWVGVLARLPLEFSPGEAWNYSVSTDVVGRLVEVVSGQSLDEFFRIRIFEPLGMSETGFFVAPEDKDRFAACYQLGRDGTLKVQDDPAMSRFLARPAFLSGGGGLISTAQDYARFAQMLTGRGSAGGRRLLGRKTVELMMMNHLPGGVDLAAHSIGGIFSESTLSGFGFGLGGAVLLDPVTAQLSGSVGDFAWGGAASTYFWSDPAEDLTVVFMTQLLPSSAINIRRELRGVVYGALI